MLNRLRTSRLILIAALAAAACLLPVNALAASLPSGERALGNATIEPAYNHVDGSIVYLLTPNRLAPLGPDNPIASVNTHAVAPLYLIAYPPGTPGTFNCMGAPGNCPDHGGVIATLATSMMQNVYGSSPLAVPGHDHLVGVAGTGGDFNVAWHVYVELFRTKAAVTHITTLAELQAAWSAKSLQEVDTGIVFACAVVSVHAYLAGTPVA